MNKSRKKRIGARDWIPLANKKGEHDRRHINCIRSLLSLPNMIMINRIQVRIGNISLYQNRKGKFVPMLLIIFARFHMNPVLDVNTKHVVIM